MYFCFFFKQKTAYEMRISDWSSDVCSSDLTPRLASSLRTWWLTALAVRCSSSAAWAKFCWRAAAANTPSDGSRAERRIIRGLHENHDAFVDRTSSMHLLGRRRFGVKKPVPHRTPGITRNDRHPADPRQHQHAT